MKMPSATPRFRSIFRAMLNRIVIIAALSVLGLGIVNSVMAYQSSLKRSNWLAKSLASTHAPDLIDLVQARHARAIEQLLASMVAYPEIASVSFNTAAGSVYQSGVLSANSTFDLVLPVQASGDEQPLRGKLSVSFDKDYLRDGVMAEVLSDALLFTLFMLVIYLIIHRSFSRHLRAPLSEIALYSQRLADDLRAPPLQLERPARPWRDEIDLVSDGFAALREGIAQSMAERDSVVEELARERDQLDARVRERTDEVRQINNFLEMLSRFSMSMIDQDSSHQGGAMDDAMEELSGRVGASACGIATFSNNGNWRWRYVWRGPGVEPVYNEAEALFGIPRSHGWSVGNDTLLSNSLTCAFQTQDRGYLLAFYGVEQAPMLLMEQRLLQMTAEVFFKLIERWQHLDKLEDNRRELFRLSRTDHLTGLANRRYFDEAKIIEGRRAQRTGSPVSVLMADVDFFKSYNDILGHGKGDDCLVQLANMLAHHCRRAGELPARLGGEEFAILLPEHDAASALEVAERVRSSVFDLGIRHPGSPLQCVSISIGCATWWGDRNAGAVETVFDALMAEADQNLYEAKSSGRNRVVASEPESSLSERPA
ncbi:diguanylate cyclase [Marinobacter salicampi]|uniref:diguanylate cyclase n=1 Tax=Marinobacter salicampi TaxID=435907 RepID=UPI001409AA46|nr:diguanylate cyclase [Marinobacter salicampi]